MSVQSSMERAATAVFDRAISLNRPIAFVDALEYARAAASVLPGDAASKLRDALRCLHHAVRDLGEHDPDSKLTYFEESPTKNAECHWRWVQLSEAQQAAIDALEPASRHIADRGQ